MSSRGGTGPAESFRSGFVALVGRPNAGKSTLMNRLVGTHVAIVSATPQTTRHQIRGVMNLPGAQVVFVDTPGLHKPLDPLGKSLNRRVRQALEDVDVVLHLIDASARIGGGDRFAGRAARSAGGGPPLLLVLNKVDAVEGGAKAALAAAQEAGLEGYGERLCVSALTGEGADELVEAIVRRLPDGPRLYPEDMVTDQPLEHRIGEAVREAVLTRVREEVPHAVAVHVTDVSRRAAGDLTDVEADIIVDRESQKGILVGKGGAMLKAVGTEARPHVEAMVGGPVFLRLRVRCKKHWRDDVSLLRRFGYADRG